MHRNGIKVVLAALLGALSVAAAGAQAREVNSLSKTDVAASFYADITGNTSSNGVQQTTQRFTGGGLIEVRHISNPLLGFEGTYSFNHAHQTYNALACPVIGSTPPCPTGQTVRANANELTADYVPSFKIGNLRPFGVLGLGVLLNQPASGQTNTTSSNKAVYVYGAGLDWGLLPHIGLRLQYRGNVYKAPSLSTVFTSSNAFMHSAEPAAGIYFRF
jgi:opacity protein-like surface antigen